MARDGLSERGGGAASVDLKEDEILQLLLCDDWKTWLVKGERKGEAWKRWSIRFCAALMRPATEDTRAPLQCNLSWIGDHCGELVFNFVGHRLVEAATKGHVEFLAERVAEVILSDPTHVNEWSCRVFNALLRCGAHVEVVGECAKAFAAKADGFWDGRNQWGLYVLQAVAQSRFEAASAVVRLWFRPDALRVLVSSRHACYMHLLLASLRCGASECRRLAAMLVMTFDNRDLCYTLLKSFLRVGEIGLQILCEIAQKSFDLLNYWFSDPLQAFLEKLDDAPPRIMPAARILPPSAESMQAWLDEDRVLQAPKPFKLSDTLSENGASAVGLYCRLLFVQFERDRAMPDEKEIPCATPAQLFATTPWMDELIYRRSTAGPASLEIGDGFLI